MKIISNTRNYNLKELDGEFGDFYCEEFKIERKSTILNLERIEVFTRFTLDRNIIFWKIDRTIYIYGLNKNFNELENAYINYKQLLREKKLKRILNGKLYTGEI